MAEPLYLYFKPLEWRCTLQRLQQITHRRIDGPGLWVSPHIRINDEILQTTLPLTFTIQVGREGADRFGRLQCWADEISQDVALHVELNIPSQDFEDFWTRSGSRIPHRIFFEVVGGLRHDSDRIIWDIDFAKDDNDLLIGSYGLMTVESPQ
jgi:hypothetical protein